MNNPLAGGWVVQSQPTGLSQTLSPGPSPVTVLGAGVGGTQIKGMQFIQSHAPLVQPTAVIPNGSTPASKQDTNEPSFSRMLINKGKPVPKKIDIAKIQTQAVDSIISVPQVQVVPATPLETVVEKTTKEEIMADPFTEQPDTKAPEMAAVDIPKSQTVIATDFSESAENIMPVDVSLIKDSKEVTNQEYTTTQDAQAEVDIEPSTDTEPTEPKEDPKQEQLEEDIPIADVSITKDIEEAAKELSGSEPLVDEKIPQDEIIQANDDPVELSATEPEGLESNKDLETVIEESQEDKPELDSEDAAISNQVAVHKEDTEQEEPSPLTPENLPVSPENDLQETKASQDPEMAKDLIEKAEQNPEIVENKEVPLATDTNLQENIDSQELETEEDTSEPAKETQEPSENDGEEILANQTEEPTEDTTEATSEIVDENVHMDQPENSEQLDTESPDSPHEETLVSEENSSDVEQDERAMDNVATSEKASHIEDPPNATSEEEDTFTQEDASASVQKDTDVEPGASTRSTPVMELSSNEEDESLEDTVVENQHVDGQNVIESNDANVKTGADQPEQDLDTDESPVDEEKEQPIVEGAAEEAGPSLEETNEASLVDKEEVASGHDDIDEKTGSMSDQEQITTEDNVKDEESPVEDQDCNLEGNVQNGGANEEPETVENPPYDQNVQEEKPPMSEEVDD